MVARKLVWILLILAVILPVSSQNSDQYDLIIPGTDMNIGVVTDAPATVNPLNYTYTENFYVRFDVYSSDAPNQVASSIEVQLRASILGDTTEFQYTVITTHDLDFFRAYLGFLAVGNERVEIGNQNISRQILKLPRFDGTTAILFSISGEFRNLQPLQFSSPVEISFTSFSPVQYSTGALDFTTWEEVILPMTVADVVILPIAAIGATLQVIQIKSSVLSSKISSKVDQYGDVITTTRATKEAVDFATDAHAIYKDSESDTSWLTRWAKITLGIYLLLLSVTSVVLFLDVVENYRSVVIKTYTVYTAAYLLVLFGFILVSFMKRPVLEEFGNIIPWSHILFIFLGSLIFLIGPLIYLMDHLKMNDATLIQHFILLSMISLGFIITSLFAGYFLARSGEAWARLLNSLMSRLKIPKVIIRSIIRVFTLGFFVIVLVRLVKTSALIITVFMNNQLANNAYLVSLAASYLNQEVLGSLWIVYGLILIFFIQTIMEIYLHIKKQEVEENSKPKPVYQAYRRLALFGLVSSLTFLHLILLLNGELDQLGLLNAVIPQEVSESLDVWNVIFAAPPFRILLDILLAIGLIIALPFVMYRMWRESITGKEKVNAQQDNIDNTELTENEESPDHTL